MQVDYGQRSPTITVAVHIHPGHCIRQQQTVTPSAVVLPANSGDHGRTRRVAQRDLHEHYRGFGGGGWGFGTPVVS